MGTEEWSSRRQSTRKNSGMYWLTQHPGWHPSVLASPHPSWHPSVLASWHL